MATEEKQIKVRRDTTANLANVVPAEGEPVYDKTNKKLAIGDGSTQFKNIDKQAKDSEVYHAKKLADRIYEGKDLTQVHAAEIAGYSSVWAWIQARITAGNFDKIHVGDYIPFQLSGGTITDGNTSYTITARTMQAQIAGIDTYKDTGYAIPANNGAIRQSAHHIDFITTGCIGTNIPYNPTDNNNGTAENHVAWLASKLYAILNGVNNYSTNAFNNVPHGYDASEGGVLQLLPQALQDVIKMKSAYMGNRYSASGLLTACTGSADIWGIGKLWLPTEVEVYGTTIHSAEKAPDGKDYNNWGAPVQYPLFANTFGSVQHVMKGYWWLSSVCGGSSSLACGVNDSGRAGAHGCAYAGYSVPLCFRI